MDLTGAAALVATMAIMFGSLTLMLRFFTNSPRRRDKAEIEKLGLLEGYQGGKNVADQLGELRSQLAEQEKQIAEIREERDFIRKLLEQKKE